MIDARQDNLNRSHLFISYASEDGEFADWLARKLAAEGYAVWYDRMKLLGGEPWVKDIDIAIKERSFRLLALLSQFSKDKANPVKERTCAVNVSKKLGIPDFIIPLKLDSADIDWQMSDLNYLPFNHGWAEGWRQLLAKLEKIAARKELKDGKTLAAATFDLGEDLVSAEPELVTTNILPLAKVSESIEHLGLDTSVLAAIKDTLGDAWAYYTVGVAEAISFGPPPREYAHVVAENRATLKRADPEGLGKRPTEILGAPRCC